MRKIAENRFNTNLDFTSEKLLFVEKTAVHRKNVLIWEGNPINKVMVPLLIQSDP